MIRNICGKLEAIDLLTQKKKKKHNFYSQIKIITKVVVTKKKYILSADMSGYKIRNKLYSTKSFQSRIYFTIHHITFCNIF